MRMAIDSQNDLCFTIPEKKGWFEWITGCEGTGYQRNVINSGIISSNVRFL